MGRLFSRQKFFETIGRNPLRLIGLGWEVAVVVVVGGPYWVCAGVIDFFITSDSEKEESIGWD